MFKGLLSNSRDFALVTLMMLILVVLFAPIPPMALDLAILMNFGFSLTILLLTFYVPKPVDFSTFPSLLLVATLLRLSLNVAATRLILTSAAAGDVINAIGTFAVGGNFVVGLVVFFILIVVQYVVVTSGAQRVSEVAARFTLDSMPGQQMSIDADLNMGLIDQAEALRRRAELEKEASFYGAMDGASKFVKGDAVAGVIILLINIVAGWIIGVMQMGMDWQEALQRFSLLTIGDGIATQLPALIISVATGIIVTRSSADRELGREVLKQLSSSTRVPLIVAGALSLMLLLPGMPKWPLALIVAAAGVAWWRMRQQRALDKLEEDISQPPKAAPAFASLSVALGGGLGTAWQSQEVQIMDRIAGLREAQEKSLGLGFPQIQIVDGPELRGKEYEIRLFGTRYAGGEIEPDQWLAIKTERAKESLDGLQTTDPAFGLPATWIREDQVERARGLGYTIVDPLTAFVTHLGEVLRTESSALLTRSRVAGLLDEVRARQPGLVEELIPNLLSVSDVQRVLQSLLAEGVSISSLDLIVEHLVDLSRNEKDVAALTESVRQRLSYIICNKLRDRHRDLAVISLDPRLENQTQASIATVAKRDALSINPRLAEHMLRQLSEMSNDMMHQGRQPVLLCGGELRRPLRALVQRSIPKLFVLSVNEIPMNIELSSFAVVRFDESLSRKLDPQPVAPEPNPA